MHITEDDIYRRSTQFLHWSFSSAQLNNQRQETNHQACNRVKATAARQLAQRNNQLDAASTSENDQGTPSGIETGSNTPIPASEQKEVVCLNAAEERKLVDIFCDTSLKLGNFLNLPIEVTATSIQFLRRFYLFNSPMIYDPRAISQSTMFLANKVEGHHMSAEKYSASLTKTNAEAILAPEYLIVQSLRFDFDVKHPFRGLKGGHLELMEMLCGNASLKASSKTPAEIQEAMLALPLKPNGPASNLTVVDSKKRITDAYGFASHILKTAALLTDAYFLYTPSQVWLSAHLLADEPLTLFYLSTKINPTTQIYSKTISTLRACASLLSSHWNFMSERMGKQEKEAGEKRIEEETKALLKKLRQYKSHGQIDFIKLNRAQKRDAVQADGELEENKAKKRKLLREKHEKECDEFWGPEIQKNGTKQE